MAFLPINVRGSHWILAVMMMAKKRIEVDDAMHGRHPTVLRKLKQYLTDEIADKIKDPNNMEHVQQWTMAETSRDVPRQRNGYDCGVFVCMYAYALSMGLDLRLLCRSHLSGTVECRGGMVQSFAFGNAPKGSSGK